MFYRCVRISVFIYHDVIHSALADGKEYVTTKVIVWYFLVLPITLERLQWKVSAGN